MVRLNLRVLSVYGKKIANSIRASQAVLNHSCSCPPGESCSVEVTELPGRRFEAVVIRPRPVADTRGWSTITAVAGMYRRLFDKRASAQRIRESVATIVGAVLDEQNRQSLPSVPPTDHLNIVVVDSITLGKARKLICGCQVCSPNAEIPFDCILDRVTGHDPAVTQYVVPDGLANCPRCMRRLDETTLVEFEPSHDQPGL